MSLSNFSSLPSSFSPALKWKEFNMKEDADCINNETCLLLLCAEGSCKSCGISDSNTSSRTPTTKPLTTTRPDGGEVGGTEKEKTEGEGGGEDISQRSTTTQKDFCVKAFQQLIEEGVRMLCSDAYQLPLRTSTPLLRVSHSSASTPTSHDSGLALFSPLSLEENERKRRRVEKWDSNGNSISMDSHPNSNSNSNSNSSNLTASTTTRGPRTSTAGAEYLLPQHDRLSFFFPPSTSALSSGAALSKTDEHTVSFPLPPPPPPWSNASVSSPLPCFTFSSLAQVMLAETALAIHERSPCLVYKQVGRRSVVRRRSSRGAPPTRSTAEVATDDDEEEEEEEGEKIFTLDFVKPHSFPLCRTCTGIRLCTSSASCPSKTTTTPPIPSRCCSCHCFSQAINRQPSAISHFFHRIASGKAHTAFQSKQRATSFLHFPPCHGVVLLEGRCAVTSTLPSLLPPTVLQLSGDGSTPSCATTSSSSSLELPWRGTAAAPSPLPSLPLKNALHYGALGLFWSQSCACCPMTMMATEHLVGLLRGICHGLIERRRQRHVECGHDPHTEKEATSKDENDRPSPPPLLSEKSEIPTPTTAASSLPPPLDATSLSLPSLSSSSLAVVVGGTPNASSDPEWNREVALLHDGRLCGATGELFHFFVLNVFENDIPEQPPLWPHPAETEKTIPALIAYLPSLPPLPSSSSLSSSVTSTPSFSSRSLPSLASPAIAASSSSSAGVGVCDYYQPLWEPSSMQSVLFDGAKTVENILAFITQHCLLPAPSSTSSSSHTSTPLFYCCGGKRFHPLFLPASFFPLRAPPADSCTPSLTTTTTPSAHASPSHDPPTTIMGGCPQTGGFDWREGLRELALEVLHHYVLDVDVLFSVVDDSSTTYQSAVQKVQAIEQSHQAFALGRKAAFPTSFSRFTPEEEAQDRADQKSLWQALKSARGEDDKEEGMMNWRTLGREYVLHEIPSSRFL